MGTGESPRNSGNCLSHDQTTKILSNLHRYVRTKFVGGHLQISLYFLYFQNNELYYFVSTSMRHRFKYDPYWKLPAAAHTLLPSTLLPPSLKSSTTAAAGSGTRMLQCLCMCIASGVQERVMSEQHLES